jgi:hypothetical protein
MVSPGLHSIYSGLKFVLSELSEDEAIIFQTHSTDKRFNLIKLAARGGGILASIDAFFRAPPAVQPNLEIISQNFSRTEFSGVNALIVGGSRGLGELTAKAIAAGGGSSVVTYAVGIDDAKRVCNEIKAWGGSCEILHYDIHENAEAQLAELSIPPTHVYYFATPKIFGNNTSLDLRRFEEFNQFYVSGFEKLIKALIQLRPTGMRAFYPSTVAVENRPLGMTAYAMSKVAGEILCADMNSQIKNLHIVIARLPRLDTDQTISLSTIQAEDALSVMKSYIREVQGT